jgi:mRNA-degrading endonuclease RelE of RelBE toxin-antitoxin system
MRTTIDIEKPVLDELKKLQRKTRQSLGKLTSSLLAKALKESASAENRKPPQQLQWKARPMGARVDLRDKDAVYRAMGEG